MKSKRVNHYVNNKQMYAAMQEFITAHREAISNSIDPPAVPKYIGECIYLICKNLAMKWQFSGYTQHWKEEMIGDAIENCLTAAGNFNPDKYTNPHAYFTMVAWHAFIRRIQKEKKETYVKHKNMQNNYILDDVGLSYSGDEKSDDVIGEFEEKIQKNKKKKKTATTKKKGVELFL